MAAPSWAQLIVDELNEEVPATRAMLEVIPAEHLDWRPHEKSWPLSHLAGHMANLLKWQVFVLQFDEFDLATVPPPDTESVGDGPRTLAIFDENVAALKSALENCPDEKLETEWSLKHGDQVIFARPRHAVIRSTGIRHLIHHRGQLGVYLRLLDIAVPSTYGPTADSGPG
ncbi:MAG: DinB family protein [Planctomycetes bacterium]|nr:DinB family protein [Planctomycetota bacterium]